MTEREDLIEKHLIWVSGKDIIDIAIASECADISLAFAKKYHKEQLILNGVGSSAIAEPYLISEKENQIEEMKKMGLFTEGILYEQSVNGLIQIIKDLKKI